MTLLVTEIHIPDDLRDSVICFVADQRITESNYAPPKHMRKIFEIPSLRAGIGFYGVAQINSELYISNWLPNFINNSSSSKSLGEFAGKLRDELNQKVEKSFLLKNASGFQICGYNSEHLPELWHICNHDMQGNFYTNFVMQYKSPSEDFLGRDASEFGYDGKSIRIPKPGRQYYVNGDVRSFHAGWQLLDSFFANMVSQKGFGQPQHLQDYLKITKWKMKVISSSYHQFAKVRIIGGPPDSFVVAP